MKILALPLCFTIINANLIHIPNGAIWNSIRVAATDVVNYRPDILNVALVSHLWMLDSITGTIYLAEDMNNDIQVWFVTYILLYIKNLKHLIWILQWEVSIYNGGVEEIYRHPKVNMTTFYNGILRTIFPTLAFCSNLPKYPRHSNWTAPLKANVYWMDKCTFPQWKLNLTNVRIPFRQQRINIDITTRNSILSTLTIDFFGYFTLHFCNVDGLFPVDERIKEEDKFMDVVW